MLEERDPVAKDTRRKPRRRANGEGSIYPYRGGHRGALTWTAADGRQGRRVVFAKTQAEVREALAKLRAERDHGVLAPASTRVRPYLAEWLEASRQRIRPATWRAYRQAVDLYLTPALGHLQLERLSPIHVEAMTAALVSSGRSPRTAHTARAVLRRALADAERDGRVNRNVAALARPPHVPVHALKNGRDYFDSAQLRRLVSESGAHPLGPLITIAAATGLRQGELLALAWGDVDLEEATLTVRRSLARSWDGWALSEPKTARSRRAVDLPATAVAALDRQRRFQESAREAAGRAWQDRDDLVFTDAVGRPLSGSYVTHTFHRLLKSAGLPSIPFHGLRHSAATAMLAGGVPLKVVSETLGHSSIVVTADRYAGVVPPQRRAAAAAMDAALSPSET